jgi:hypothetical protein
VRICKYVVGIDAIFRHTGSQSEGDIYNLTSI